MNIVRSAPVVRGVLAATAVIGAVACAPPPPPEPTTPRPAPLVEITDVEVTPLGFIVRGTLVDPDDPVEDLTVTASVDGAPVDAPGIFVTPTPDGGTFLVEAPADPSGPRTLRVSASDRRSTTTAERISSAWTYRQITVDATFTHDFSTVDVDGTIVDPDASSGRRDWTIVQRVTSAGTTDTRVLGTGTTDEAGVVSTTVAVELAGAGDYEFCLTSVDVDDYGPYVAVTGQSCRLLFEVLP